ncbi:hypothetical protein QUF74_17190, partial [Candidatus Halobeggiatoa sp. HSG11]|nr:hypothetical protein [Candidatus Halobeggiatoa sp. HSG11]
MEKSDFNLPILLDYIKSENIRPEDIKLQIIETFEPYFRNHENLEKYSIRFLIPEWINYSTLSISNHYVDDIQRIVEILNYLKDTNANKILDLFVKWSDEINKSSNIFWSFKNLETPKNDLDLHDFVVECLNNIGQNIEGLIKPYLKWYFHIFS